MENEEDLKRLDEQVKVFLDKALKSEEIQEAEIKARLGNFRRTGFEPGDLSPDKIEQLVVDAKNALAQTDSTKFSFQGSASASYLGLGGSASASFNRESLRQEMMDKGWKIEVKGSVYDPKSLNVYVVDKTALTKDLRLDISIAHRIRDAVSFGGEATTSRGFPVTHVVHDLIAEPNACEQRILQARADLRAAAAQVRGNFGGITERSSGIGSAFASFRVAFYGGCTADGMVQMLRHIKLVWGWEPPGNARIAEPRDRANARDGNLAQAATHEQRINVLRGDVDGLANSGRSNVDTILSKFDAIYADELRIIEIDKQLCAMGAR